MAKATVPLVAQQLRSQSSMSATVDTLSVGALVSDNVSVERVLLAALPTPLFVLRADGYIEYENAAASRAHSRRYLLRHRNGRILAIGGDYRSWSAALRQATQGAGCVMPFAHIDDGTILTGIVRLAPIRMQTWPAATVLALLEFREESEYQAALTLFAARHSLTAMELKVLQLLAEGLTPRDAAVQMNIQVSTVRTHLRSMFNKTGLRRQSDLLRVVAR